METLSENIIKELFFNPSDDIQLTIKKDGSVIAVDNELTMTISPQFLFEACFNWLSKKNIRFGLTYNSNIQGYFAWFVLLDEQFIGQNPMEAMSKLCNYIYKEEL
jgi:hypothetical protein